MIEKFQNFCLKFCLSPVEPLLWSLLQYPLTSPQGSKSLFISIFCAGTLPSTNQAYDFMKRDVVDAIETGLIDPVKVTISALTNAVSVASTLITTNHAIVKQ